MAIRFGKLKINRLWALVVVALVLGLLATWLSVTYLRNREQAIQAEIVERTRGGAKVSVIVATRDLPAGTVLDDSVVAAREIPADLVYADTLDVEQFEAVAGKPLLLPALKGRPLLRAQVFDDRPREFSHSIEAGMRAFTIDIDELNSIAQMIKPGDRIDLYLISSAPADGAGQAGQQVFPFLQYVKVVATGRRTDAVAANPNAEPRRPDEQFQTVTVEVTPEEAAVIALAQQAGRIRTTLRSPNDDEDTGFGVLTTAHLAGLGRRKPGEPGSGDAMPAQRVEYIVGGKGGAGAAPPININVPGLSMPGAGAAIPGMPATVSQSVANAAAPK